MVLNGKIISYGLSERPNFNQILSVPKFFLKQTNLILHLVQGWQYLMKRYLPLIRTKKQLIKVCLEKEIVLAIYLYVFCKKKTQEIYH